MRKLRLLSILLLAFTFIVNSCTKEGPEGPVGAIGPQGPAGTTGTANVIYSSWASFVASNWADSTMTNLGLTKRANRTAPGITQAILDNGIVLAYTKNPNAAGEGPYILPFTVLSSVPNILLGYIPALGRVIYYNQKTDNSGGVTPNSAYQYRYFIIPGGVSGGRGVNSVKAVEINGQTYTESQLNGMSYQQVCTLFKIPQ